jgi:hypothetical protein
VPIYTGHIHVLVHEGSPPTRRINERSCDTLWQVFTRTGTTQYRTDTGFHGCTLARSAAAPDSECCRSPCCPGALPAPQKLAIRLQNMAGATALSFHCGCLFAEHHSNYAIACITLLGTRCTQPCCLQNALVKPSCPKEVGHHGYKSWHLVVCYNTEK